MVLDVEFRQLLQREFEKTLNKINEYKKDDLSKVWQCDNEDDFLYGWHMGKVDDFCVNQYFVYYHKSPTK